MSAHTTLEKAIQHQLMKNIAQLGSQAKNLDWFAGNLHAEQTDTKKAA